MRALLLCVLAAGPGCSLLFPELDGPPRDAGASDAGGVDAGPPTTLAGTVCLLGDVRDYRSCVLGTPGALRITVEETRQSAMTDNSGRFSLPLPAAPLVTLAVVDPRGRYATTIVPLRTAGGGQAVLPLVEAQLIANIATQNAQLNDPQHGTLLAWTTDATGTPVAGVGSNQPTALFDDSAPNQLSAGTSTRGRGALALFDLTPAQVTLQLTPPATSGLRSDAYTMPIRSGAVTATLIILSR